MKDHEYDTKKLWNLRGGADVRGGATRVTTPPSSSKTTTLPTTVTTTTTTTTISEPIKPTKSNMDDKKKASIATSVFNLANNVAGAGILTLAAGKATGTGWIPSILICITLAFVSSHTFALIGKSCEMTGENSFKGLWSIAFGKNTAYIVDSMVFVQCFFVSIIYIGLLGDVFSTLLKNAAFLPPQLKSRTGIILMASTCILWPLNMIRDLSALGFTSILGLCAVLYTVFFIVWRCLDGTYSLGVGTAAAGKFIVDNLLEVKPSFAKSTMWNFDLNSLVLMSNLGLAFIAHYNGPSYWTALANATSERFQKVSLRAYTILAMIYVVTMCAGYATFGDNCHGNILLNYHPHDILATLGRIATGISIIFGFPLISNGVREGFKNTMTALGIFLGASNPKHHTKLVSAMLFVTTCLAIVLKDIKLVAGLTGAIMGSSLVYICPTLIYTRIVRLYTSENSLEYQRAKRNLVFIPFGIFVALMGVTMTIKNTILS